MLIELDSDQANIIINISDDGDGVPIQLREHIFKPFCRGDENLNNKNLKGHGIGLAIVKRIIEWHQGSITVTNSSKLSGAKFTLNLCKSDTNHS